MKFTPLETFLIFASGKCKETLSRCGMSEVEAIKTIGSTVLVSTLLGFATVTYGVYIIYETLWLAIIGGIGMGTLIFIIDRAIVSYGRKVSPLTNIIRLVITLSFSLVMSTMVMVGVFDDAIKQQEMRSHLVEVEEINNRYDDIIIDLEDELLAAKNTLDAKERSYLEEIDGSGGSGKFGIGGVAKAKKKVLEAERQAYALTKERITNRINTLEDKRGAEITEVKKSRAFGLLGSLIALFSIQRPEVHVSIWVLHIFFAGFDLAPLILKNTKRGTILLYDQMEDLEQKNILEATKITAKQAVKFKKQEKEAALRIAGFELQSKELKQVLEAHKTNADHLSQQLIVTMNDYIRNSTIIEKSRLSQQKKEEYLAALTDIYNQTIEAIERVSGKATGSFNSYTT